MATPDLNKINTGIRKSPLTTKRGGIVQVFLNVDMRNMHNGLGKIAKESGIDVNQLDPGQYVVFINSQKNKVKIFASNDVVAYHRTKSGKIQMETIREIPRSFRGGAFDYDSALRVVLEKLIGRSRDALN